MDEIPVTGAGRGPAAATRQFAQGGTRHNVNSVAGDVERRRVSVRRLLGALLLWGLAGAGLVGSAGGCVETAECTATLACPGDQVCYEYRCRARCEDQSQCLAGQVCAACQQIKGTHDPGKCFGEDLNACVENP